MRNYRFLGRTVFITLLLSSVLILWSCSSVSTTSPSGGEEAWTEGSGDNSDYAEAFIHASVGGSLVMGNNSVFFPPGSLAEDTLVSIMREGDDPVFELNPDGIQFLAPVSLTLEMPSRSGGLMAKTFVIPAIWYYNEASTEWERIGGTSNWSDRTVTANIEHFSRYGTGGPWWGGMGVN